MCEVLNLHFLLGIKNSVQVYEACRVESMVLEYSLGEASTSWIKLEEPAGFSEGRSAIGQELDIVSRLPGRVGLGEQQSVTVPASTLARI